MKKSVSLILSLLMVISIITSVPLTASAASKSDLTFKRSYNDDCSYVVSDCKASAKGKIVIPDTYNGLPVVGIDWNAFENCKEITSVVIPDSVTSIGGYAFRWCTSLKSVVIPDSVTRIIHGAFYGCKSLTSIAIPGSVTSIYPRAFYRCSALKSITISDGVDEIGSQAFSYTAYYKDKSNWDNSVLYIGKHLITADGSLKGTYKIKSGTVTIADEAFSGQNKITAVTIPDSVVNIGYDAFLNCEGLKSIVIPDSVKVIFGNAFKNCTGLSSVTIPDSVKTIGYLAFYNTGYYNNRKNWDKSALYIGNHLIRARASLNGDYEIKNDTITIADNAFSNRKNLKSVTIPVSVAIIGASAFEDCTGLTSVTIGKAVKSIESRAFAFCSKLSSIIVPDSVKEIGEDAFLWCKKIKAITLGKRVKNIGYSAFWGCESLESITIPASVKSIGYGAFVFCNRLNSVYITDVAAWCNIYFADKESNPFSVADNLYVNGQLAKKLVIPEGVKSISWSAFRGCKCITSITIPDSVESIGYLAFYDTGYYNNRKNWDKSALYIGNHLIRARHSLTGVYEVKEGTITIADMAFRDCDKLTSVKIHSSVKNIGKDVFYGCDKIKE